MPLRDGKDGKDDSWVEWEAWAQKELMSDGSELLGKFSDLQVSSYSFIHARAGDSFHLIMNENSCVLTSSL